MHLTVIGDIHAQRAKFWTMLREAGLADEANAPTERLKDPDTKLILLGDLVHAKSRERYAELTHQSRYDEYTPEHRRKAEEAQEVFLWEVKRFYDALPAGRMVILMGNHDFNAVTPTQGPLRTDEVSHLEWKEGRPLPDELRAWMESWPFEETIKGVHFAHVGPLPEHNRYDNAFYLENRRRWIYEERDFLVNTPYRMGVYGHTPVRGGVNFASRGRALLLDTNGHGDEYAYLEIDVEDSSYRLKMRGLVFDELVRR